MSKLESRSNLLPKRSRRPRHEILFWVALWVYAAATAVMVLAFLLS